MKWVYLGLAIMGAVVPYLFFGQFFVGEGVNLVRFVSALFVNSAAGGFTADLLISSLVFWGMMFYERGRTGGKSPSPFLFMGLNLLIGLSCALPAYLYARERLLESN